MIRPAILLLLLALTVSGALLIPATSAEAQVRPHQCDYCHNLHGATGSLPLTDFGQDAVLCLSCHYDGAPLTYDGKSPPGGVAVHGGAKHDAGDTTSCKDCHDHFGETNGNLSLIPNSLVSKYPLAGGGETKTVVLTSLTGTNSFADGDATYDGICETCHTATNYHRNNATGDHLHNQGVRCSTCHTHDTGFAPPSGGGCSGCHNSTQGSIPRRAIFPDYTYTSHHIDWNSAGYASELDIPPYQCQICHNQAGHQDQTVTLNDVDAFEITEIATTSAGTLDGAYFILNTPTPESVAFWIDVDDSGTGEPAHGAARSIEITTITNAMTAAEVATEVAAAIGADADFVAFDKADLVTVKLFVQGAVTDATPGNSGFTVNIVNQGAVGSGPYDASIASEMAAFCLGCHDNNGGVGVGGIAPFVDGLTPPVIDGAQWLATQHGGAFTGQACLECHDNGHGINKTRLFDVCNDCHGDGSSPTFRTAYQGTAPYARNHDHPSIVPAPWNLDCKVCHTPHAQPRSRYYYPPYVGTEGDLHPHNHASDAGVSVAGYNIKLLGRTDDGSNIAKIATPQEVVGFDCVGCSAPYSGTIPCSAGNTAVQVNLPPYSFGDGPPTTVMVGDRITLTNAGADFTGVYKVEEVFHDAWPTTAWVCFDHPNPPGNYNDLGHLHSAGWGQKPQVRSAEWVSGTPSGTAKLRFSGPTSVIYGIHSIKVNDWINVLGVLPGGYNGRFQVTAVSDTSVSYDVLTDPGAYLSGGEVEYAGSVKGVQNITTVSLPPEDFAVSDAVWKSAQGQNPDRAEITVGNGHGYVQNDTVVVSGVVPAGYNGTFTVRSVSTTTITYPLTPDPGAYVSGGTVPDLVNPNVNNLEVTLNAGNDDTNILNIRPATGKSKNGDVVTLYGVNPIDYDFHYQVRAVDTSVNPPILTLRCPPFNDNTITTPAPVCDIGLLPAYVSGGTIQSSGSLRAVVFDARGADHPDTTRYSNDWTHSFTNTDNDEDGWMDQPCEICHTLTSNHSNDDFGNTHNNGTTCSTRCHFHGMAFDKTAFTCPVGRTCPTPK